MYSCPMLVSMYILAGQRMRAILAYLPQLLYVFLQFLRAFKLARFRDVGSEG